MVFEEIKSIISQQLDVDEDEITMDTSFQDDLNADSLDLVELIMTFEDEYELEVEDDEVENIKTVKDVVEYIQNRLNLD
ncbi:acyl carrier protein [Anaerosalibacter massiliensis]|uniref:Acyl carrier protein n=2 Tax=Anaerosalibacter massiliensis TaxID=1347392 RepID=A0A9X2MGD6_9FIRM|nr:acyl carrier protein [Anaerosalibacter massiliensis]MCR2042595.1 acyl carrier protein [Anaerosalibacter massiliensis]